MSDLDPRIGTTLKSKWRIDARLGRGGMATVYAATHRNGKRVAIKMLHPELSAIPEMRERFLREGYVGNKVGHRGAVTVDDDDLAPDGAAFLVMELLEGETLEARRERMPEGRLPPREVAGFMDQVLDTLASAHAQGIVHRDLKPENLFLTTEGVVKILDFGIARLRDGAATKSATTTGTLMGTPAYLPPEQARGEWKDVDGRSDLWAIGATMFELLTGRCVHEAETVPLLLLAAMTQSAPALRSVAPEVPEELAAIVDRALLRDREARWPDARTMQGALHDILAEGVGALGGGIETGKRAAPFGVVAYAPTVASERASFEPGRVAVAATAAPVPSVSVLGAAPSVGRATAAPITSRTLSPTSPPRRPAVLIAVAAFGALGVIGGVAWLGTRSSAGTASASASASASIETSAAPVVVTITSSAPITPSVVPATATADTKPIPVTDLPDVLPSSTTTDTARPRSTPIPKAPITSPTTKPSAGKPADPFSARR